MIILSFDSAVKNLGICCVEYDDGWRNKVGIYISKLNDLYCSVNKMTTSEFITQVAKLFSEIDEFLKQIIVIRFINVFDIVGGKTSSNIDSIQKTRQIKSLLKSIDTHLPRPDTVLIEYQMVQNDKSRTLSQQILYHYSDLVPCSIVDATKQYTDKSVGMPIYFAVNAFPISSAVIETNLPSIHIELVGPSLKNQIAFYEGGSYENFIAKYTSKTANKKHTTENFKRYLSVTGMEYILDGVKNKIDDMADAFMMTFSWLVKKKMI